MGSWHWLCTGAVLVAVMACASWQAQAAVISIDYGGEWVKVALVKPGVPMEIVLNKESQRKTAAIVSMRNDERLFGDAALSTGVKYPKTAYRYLQLLLGQKFDSPLATKYRQWFPYYDMRKDEERGTILFQHDSENAYSPEELVAMILNNTRIAAQDYAEQPIRDCVITIPVFYTQAQRRAMLYAANLVGLNVLQLMTDAAATALNYGLFRQASFNTTPQYIMFYDVGALSTTASIIEYRKAQVKEGSVANTYPQLAVRGVGYDRLLGGLEIDIRLRDHLARSFESQKKTQGSVFDSPRAMGKLLKEAKRVKQVLSANADHHAQVEGLLEDVDFRFKVTREELDELCSDLYDRVQEPVKQALEAADITVGEIDSVILMGGCTRVPRIQEALLKAVNKPELGRSLNTDEAAALGAVYQAAGQTKLFRVKKFIVKDANVLPIAVSFEKRVSPSGETEEGEEEEFKIVKKTLFQRSNAYPQKKVLTFNRYSKDFPFSVYYSHLGFLSEEEKSYVGRVNLSEVFLVGVGDTLSAHSDAEAKGIKAHFRMDESGLLLLDYVESIFEYPPDEEEQSTFAKIGSTLSNLFGGGSSETETTKEPSAEQPTEPAAAGEEEGEGEEARSEGEGSDTGGEEGEGDSEEETGGREEEMVQEEEEMVQDGEEREEEMVQEEEEMVQDGEEREEEMVQEEEEMVQDGEEREEEMVQEEEEMVQDGEEREEEMVQEEEREEQQPHSDEEEEVKEEEAAHEEEEEAAAGEDSPESAADYSADEAPPTEEATPTSKEQEQDEKGSEKDSEPTPDAQSSNESESTKKKKEEEEEKVPASRTVKVNLTAEITTLDLTPPSSADVELSTAKLRALQERDEEKVANEKAKNNLESYIFETRSWLEVTEVITVSTEEQREEIRDTVGVVSDWFEEEGYYSAETAVYKEKLRELKRARRSLRKRVEEAEKRPKLINHLKESINISVGFVLQMRNISSDLNIFTEVEINTLETLVNESMEWLTTALSELEASPPHEDPPILAHQFEEQQGKLDREMMYLINKIKTHVPPKPKPSSNATTNATDNGTATETDGEAGGEGSEEKETAEADGEEEPVEPLELPPADDLPTTGEVPSPDGTPNEEGDLPTSATQGTPRGEL